MTNILQPADVCWFRSIKAQFNTKWNEWIINEDKTYTAHGNPRSPGYAEAINWLSEIWRNFDSNIIVKSFECTDIIGNRSMLHNGIRAILNEMSTQDYIDFDFFDNLESDNEQSEDDDVSEEDDDDNIMNEDV